MVQRASRSKRSSLFDIHIPRSARTGSQQESLYSSSSLATSRNSSGLPSSSSAKDDIFERLSAPKPKKNNIFERLSAPKLNDRRWLPDRPSVYWLDYLIDPTPHQITDSVELSSYYEKFRPKFPRLSHLATPRKYEGDDAVAPSSMPSNASLQKGKIPAKTSSSYVPSERIIELAKPKRSKEKLSTESHSFRPTVNRPPFTLSGIRAQESTQEKYADLARGDYASRSKHGIHEVISKDTFPFTTKHQRPSKPPSKTSSKDKCNFSPGPQERPGRVGYRRPFLI